jgi:hypothetical protein
MQGSAREIVQLSQAHRSHRCHPLVLLKKQSAEEIYDMRPYLSIQAARHQNFLPSTRILPNSWKLIMQLSLVHLSALLSFGIASPAPERRQSCDPDADCADQAYCTVEDSISDKTTKGKSPHIRSPGSISIVCHPISEKPLDARNICEQDYDCPNDEFCYEGMFNNGT